MTHATKFAWVLSLAGVLAVSACDKAKSNSIVVVKVSTHSALPDILQLQVDLENNGDTDVELFPQSKSSVPIKLDTTFAVTLPKSHSGWLKVTVTGLDAMSNPVASGGDRVAIVVGGRADLNIVLGPVVASDAGLVDVGTSDAPVAEVAPLDAGVSPDVGAGGRDIAGNGGAGGTTTAPLPTGGNGGGLGTGGVGTGGRTTIAAGGATAVATGGNVTGGTTTNATGGNATGGVTTNATGGVGTGGVATGGVGTGGAATGGAGGGTTVGVDASLDAPPTAMVTVESEPWQDIASGSTTGTVLIGPTAQATYILVALAANSTTGDTSVAATGVAIKNLALKRLAGGNVLGSEYCVEFWGAFTTGPILQQNLTVSLSSPANVGMFVWSLSGVNPSSPVGQVHSPLQSIVSSYTETFTNTQPGAMVFGAFFDQGYTFAPIKPVAGSLVGRANVIYYVMSSQARSGGTQTIGATLPATWTIYRAGIEITP